MIESRRVPHQVEFDPKNKEHQEALVWLIFYGRQHPTLRFRIKDYANVREEMVHKALAQFISEKIQAKVAADIDLLEAQKKAKFRLIDGNKTQPEPTVKVLYEEHHPSTWKKPLAKTSLSN